MTDLVLEKNFPRWIKIFENNTALPQRIQSHEKMIDTKTLLNMSYQQHKK